MYEVELKVQAAHDAVLERLRALDATPEDSVTQVDTYYDAPHRDFAESDEALRIRRESHADEETTRLTYKGPLVETASKTREEHETVVGDGEATAAILDGLGFAPAADVRKTRRTYAVDDLTVTLDLVEGLGEFVEVETAVETADDVAPARDRAKELLRELEVDPADGIRTSYLELLLEDSSE